MCKNFFNPKSKRYLRPELQKNKSLGERSSGKITDFAEAHSRFARSSYGNHKVASETIC